MSDDLTEPSPAPRIPEIIGPNPNPPTGGYSEHSQAIENNYRPLEGSLPKSVSHKEILDKSFGSNFGNIGPAPAKGAR